MGYIQFSSVLPYLPSSGDLGLVNRGKLFPLPAGGARDPVGVAVAPVLPFLQGFVELPQCLVDRLALDHDVVVSSCGDLAPKPQGLMLAGERLGKLEYFWVKGIEKVEE